MSERTDHIAKIIATWFLEGAEANHPSDEPATWRGDGEFVIGVDGSFDCRKLAAAIEAALSQEPKP